MKHNHRLQKLPSDAAYDEMPSPVGTLTIIGSPLGLHAILWDSDRPHSACETIINTLSRSATETVIIATKQQLSEYFQGQRQIFDLPLVFNGTPFQNQAWQQLLQIPYGQTISYGEQARKIGDKNKARAVGMANGLNPISIVIPCHRVIGSNGRLVGFGGGLNNKAFLLQLEQANLKNAAHPLRYAPFINGRSDCQISIADCDR